jgi:predicted nucleic acid-binding protein
VTKFVLDTNVFIQAIRNTDARAALADWQRRMAPHIYQHAVVVAEILVGAADVATWQRWRQRWIEPAERLKRIFVPGRAAWLRASRIVARLAEAGEIRPGNVGTGFFNDCLLAATAREEGFTLVTHNRRDFERIVRVEPEVRYVPPFP